MSENRSQGGTQLTLREVLDQPSLGLNLVTSNSLALNRSVTGAHSFEISRPTRWFSAHWIALTTGMRLKGKPREQRELVAELHDAGISALGFALDINFKAVPPALLESAQMVDLAVFTVPFATGFAEIIAYVNQALLSPHVNALRRFVSVQEHLLDSLLSVDAVGSLIGRLAPLIPAEVVLLNNQGTVSASSDNLDISLLPEIVKLLSKDPVNLVRSTAADFGSPNRQEGIAENRSPSLTQLLEFETSRGLGLALAVRSPNQDSLWLALVKTQESALEPGFHLSLPLIRSAGHILSIALETKYDKQSQRRASERALIADLLGSKLARPQPTRGVRSTTERLLEMNFDFGQPVHVACAISISDLGVQKSTIEANLAKKDQRDHPVLWDIQGEYLVAIVQCETATLAAFLTETLGGQAYTFGISAPIESATGFSQGYREALAALFEVTSSVAIPDSPTPGSSYGPRALYFADCSMVSWFLAYVDSTALLTKQTERASALSQERHAVTTLRAYLEFNLDVNRAAAALGIHPNSMRYRLNKVREIKGIDLEDFASLVDLYLALKILPKS